MSQPTSNNSASLKRQLIFLKSIDQKLEGLRRENERLLRLASNPRVAFSRSSLAGLYRIINSLVSAGPMYGFTEIEKWAATWRDHLISLGKHGKGPTPDELERLLLAIGELGRLRDEAMASVEKKMKAEEGRADVLSDELIPVEDAELQEPENLVGQPAVAPPDAEADFPVEAEPPESPWSSNDGKSDPKKTSSKGEAEFPFLDEPKAKPLTETAFAPKAGAEKVKNRPEPRPPLKVNKRGREESNTIPIALDEISMIGTVSKIPPGESKPRDKRLLIWKVLSLVFFVGFVVMTGLYLKEINGEKTAPKENPAQANIASSPAGIGENPKTASTPKAAPTENAVPPKESVPSSVSQDEETQKVNGTNGNDGKDEKAVGKEKSAAKESKPSKSSSSSSSSSLSSSKSKPSSSASSSTSSSSASGSSDKSANKEMGTLAVQASGDGADIFVLVDGISKGKAPLKTTLPPGLHEVVFTAGGKRSMRMVPIKTGQTKTITAQKPE